MTAITINLPDDQATAFKARASEQGLSLESWISRQLLDKVVITTPTKAKAAAERIMELQQLSKPDPDGWSIKDYITYGRH